MKKVTGISLLIMVFIFCGGISCGQKAGEMVAQEEYDAIKAQLAAAEARIAQLEATPVLTVAVPEDPALKNEIASLKAKIETLGSEITELKKQDDSLTQEKVSLEDRYAVLLAQYQELQKTVVALTQPEIITEEQVENEIFILINLERVQAGVPELLLGRQLYNHAKQNSRAMAASGKVESDMTVTYQEVFWAAGYDTVDAIARGALLTWKIDQYGFEHGALLPGNIYGAVGAYQSGEIIYVTFMAAFFP
jgi:hypothetical protein